MNLKAYVSEEILNWHCLSLNLNADLCIHFYWLSWLRQASHRKMIQSSVHRLRLWLCHFKISDTPAFSSSAEGSESRIGFDNRNSFCESIIKRDGSAKEVFSKAVTFCILEILRNWLICTTYSPVCHDHSTKIQKVTPLKKYF